MEFSVGVIHFGKVQSKYESNSNDAHTKFDVQMSQMTIRGRYNTRHTLDFPIYFSIHWFCSILSHYFSKMIV